MHVLTVRYMIGGEEREVRGIELRKRYSRKYEDCTLTVRTFGERYSDVEVSLGDIVSAVSEGERLRGGLIGNRDIIKEMMGNWEAASRGEVGGLFED